MKKQYPVDYISLTQGYSSSHRAIDLGWRDNPNQDIFSCGDGVVERIYSFSDGGNVVKIKYDDGISSEFMHLKNNSIIVKQNDRVKIGQKIAVMGDTGLTTGPHLHLIIYDENGNRQNPLNYLYAFSHQTVNPKDESIVMKNSFSESEYIVKKGDNLSSIATKYNTTYQELARYNNIENPNLIKPNQVIKIPTASNNIVYTVKKGDTLSSIASKYNTTWQEIYNKNKDTIGSNPNLIKPNQQLIIDIN